MAEINELWQAVAGGLLAAWEAKLAACTSQADREIQDTRNAWPGWLTAQSYGAMGHTMSQDTLGLLYDEIPHRVSNPTIRDQIAAGKPPFVVSAAVSGGNTLTCVAPGAPIVTMVYKWLNDGTRRWEQIGLLTDDPSPGAGVYVLVNKSQDTSAGVVGLPSLFLTLTS